jgi:hypothetical protein
MADCPTGTVTFLFFSARMGCHVYQPLFGIDLAALCVRPEAPQG